MKFVADLVSGIRTIKCYAWENHYMEKIISLRKKQQSIITKANFYGTLGFSIFQNLGLIVVLILFVIDWSQGVEI